MKKVITMVEDVNPLHTPKSELKSVAKLTNMFADDLPQGDQEMPTQSVDPSGANMFSIKFTEAAAATDFDLYALNPKRPNNNNNPGRGQIGRGRAPPLRGVPRG